MPVVCDELGIGLHLGDCLDVMAGLPGGSVDSVVTDPPAGIAFMGKSWDANRGGRARWVGWLTERMVQAHRVLKPGGHALVWALPRTSHWTALALDDAGFEIRDCITHLFGTGFPKSLDISKAIDRAAGAQREVIRPCTYELRNEGGYSGGLNTTTPRSESCEITAPATAEAVQWRGWGTALKPASEHWWLVRKPFHGTVVGNVLAYGTGALNIDGCRVACSERLVRPSVPRTDNDVLGKGLGAGVQNEPNGRWPPNVVLTHQPLLGMDGEVLGDACADGCVGGCPVAELDRQSGTLATCGGPKKTNHTTGMFHLGQPGSVYGDSGGASRFFPTFRYQAKAPTSERPKIDGKAHPTVKSLGLMRWLVRLITPPGGVVLDPFAGTGATGEAARAESFGVILIDSDPQSIEWAIERLQLVSRVSPAGFEPAHLL